MTSFNTLSALVRAIFALWSLLLCLAEIVNVILPLWKKRYLFSLLALGLFVPVYFMWQVIFDIALFSRLGIEVSSISTTLGGIAWAWWLASFITLTAFISLILGYNIRYEKNRVTLGSIKKYLDKLPCGVCCWKDNGRVLFANMCISDLCIAITDEQLLNGNSFYDVVENKILTVNGKMWRFTCRDLMLGKERMHEMIASDITAEYAKTQALETDKEELSRLNAELKEYTLSIDETVRRQEILQAKINIHDEMNRLMLSTVSAKNDDVAAMDKLFSLWEHNALLLCMQADDTAGKQAFSHVEELCKALGIRLAWREEMPLVLTERQRGLWSSVAREAVVNAVKHANAKEMEFFFAVTEGCVECRFVNDGKIPDRDVVLTGGLANLSRLAEKQGAKLKVDVDEKFTLLLVLPRKISQMADV